MPAAKSEKISDSLTSLFMRMSFPFRDLQPVILVKTG
jgi:hypothetical protein